MIYEVRTYTLKPASVAKFEEEFAKGYEVRQKYSKMAFLGHTDIGPLNQVVHIWPYEDLSQRQEIRAKAVADPSKMWPPHVGELEVEMQSDITFPAPFMRPLTGEPQALGGIYEMRIYTYQTGAIPQVIKLWSEAVPYREKYSPLAAALYTELGGLNKWIHIWPYKDLGERTRIRAEANKDPHWPAPTQHLLAKQENKILVPASCSPLH